MSNRLRDAISYTKNQKKYLVRFLEDGTIPIDDGYTERKIRTFAISKRSSLFSNSIRGAEASAIMYSILETAKANNANVFLYLKYLLEEVSKHLDDTDLSFLDMMMPWSPKYKIYESEKKKNLLTDYIQGTPGAELIYPKIRGIPDLVVDILNAS